jgi:nucleoside-diphosphate-sugar epimerase
LVVAYNQVFDLPYTIVRPSALYGERCVSRRVGQIFIENALTGKEISIAGDGSDRLDFTYVKDLVNGIELIIRKKEALNQTFNLTYGESRSLSDMAQIMQSHFPGLEVNYETKDKLTPDRGTLSIEKATDLLGYQPERPLEKGYVEYIDWYKEFWENRRPKP